MRDALLTRARILGWMGPRIEAMNHNEAVQQMAAERYLLDELTSGVRDEFEEHMFDCPKCAFEVRAGVAFVDEAKVQLPGIATDSAAREKAGKAGEGSERGFSWWRPVFAVPVFAAMLIVVGYQNLVTIPAFRNAESQPRIVALGPMSGATRGGAPTAITADRTLGVALPVDLPLEPGLGNFVSYSFGLNDPQGKPAWTGSIAAPAQEDGGDLRLSIVIPGGMLQAGTYSLAVSGVGAHGERTAIGQYAFAISLTK
jgi:hypothetical protein